MTRGLLAKARRGEWTQGQPPIGYRVDENDRLILGPPDEIEIVNRIFREYLAGGSLGSVTVGLNADGILSPTGNRWNRWTVSRILKRRLYIGAFVWNADPRGKYSQVRGGRVQRVTGDTQIRVSDAEVGIPTSDEIFIPDNHPAIISHEVFDAVQRRLSQQRVNHGDFSPSPDRYALTGLLWCGKCDQRMQGRCQGGYQFYMCGGAGRGLCTQNSVRQDKLLREIFGAVHTHLADPARLERFKQAVRRHENQGSKANSKATISRLENQITVLEQKLDRAANRLILVDDEQLPSVQKQIGKLQDERDQLALQLSNAREPVSRTISDLDSHVSTLVKRLESLQQAVTGADMGLMRKFMQTAVHRIDLNVDSTQVGKRMRYRLTGGRIELAPSCCGLLGVVGSHRALRSQKPGPKVHKLDKNASQRARNSSKIVTAYWRLPTRRIKIPTSPFAYPRHKTWTGELRKKACH